MLRFSIRQIFAGVACVAGILGILMWLHRSFQIDAASGQLLVDGEHVLLAWKAVPWTAGQSGVCASPGSFISTTCSPVSDGGDEIPQHLFRLSYKDHFGKTTFDVNAKLWVLDEVGTTNRKLFAWVLGGGNTDGACAVVFHYDDPKKMLSVNITQSINSARTAKEARLQYVFDGEHFRLLTTTSQPLDENVTRTESRR